MNKKAAWLLAGLSLVILTTLVFPVISTGISFKDMDWDNNGRVSIDEFFKTSRIGHRKVGACTEYFLLKDGSPVKNSCDGRQ